MWRGFSGAWPPVGERILDWLWSILPMVPTVVALIDYFRRRPEVYWFFVIVFFPTIGPIVYFLVVVLPNSAVEGAVSITLSERRRKKELEARIGQAPLPGLLAELGELYYKDGQFEPAAKYLADALDKGIDHLEARFYLGLACERLGRTREAIDHLVKVVRVDPKFRYMEALLALGRNLEADGQLRDAEAAYRQVLQTHTYAEARARLAELLEKKGQNGEVRKLYELIVTDAMGQPRYIRRREAPYIRKAKLWLKTHAS